MIKGSLKWWLPFIINVKDNLTHQISASDQKITYSKFPKWELWESRYLIQICHIDEIKMESGIATPSITHKKDRGVSKMETPSGTQQMTIINESSLSSLIPPLPICLSALRPNRLWSTPRSVDCSSPDSSVIHPNWSGGEVIVWQRTRLTGL